jgi:hypothetical protein
VHFDKTVAARPIAWNRCHDRIDGARVVGAKREHRGSCVTRAGATDVETRWRRTTHRIKVKAICLRRRIHQPPRVTGARSETTLMQYSDALAPCFELGRGTHLERRAERTGIVITGRLI